MDMQGELHSPIGYEPRGSQVQRADFSLYHASTPPYLYHRWFL